MRPAAAAAPGAGRKRRRERGEGCRALASTSTGRDAASSPDRHGPRLGARAAGPAEGSKELALETVTSIF